MRGKNILILTGRNKDVIKKGGYFINLIEIEESTKSFDNKIENVAAVKINDEFYGEDYLLYILIKEKIKLCYLCLNVYTNHNYPCIYLFLCQ